MLADLRPRATTEIVDASVQLFRRHARPLFVIAALIAIPQWLLGLAMSASMPQVDATLAPTEAAGSIGVVFGFSIIVLAWVSVGFGALVLAAANAYLHDAPSEPVPSFRSAMGHAGRLMVANVLAYLRAALAAALVLLLLMIPLGVGAALVAGIGELATALLVIAAMAVAVWIFCAELGRALLVTPLVMLEERTTLDALRRSRRLTAGFVGRVAVLVFVSGVISIAVSLGALAVGQGLLGNTVVANVLGSVLLLPLYPAIACLVVVLYYDLRIRKEGLDLELLAGAPAGSAA